eukprot:389663-Rhodomonas_salina.1
MAGRWDAYVRTDSAGMVHVRTERASGWGADVRTTARMGCETESTNADGMPGKQTDGTCGQESDVRCIPARHR